MRLPDFIIIGAMKCATSTLHEQLARQPGIFMSTPKEPNFFSDDPQFERGVQWYANLFQDAPANALCGESSTHYTKLPTYPRTVERMVRHLPSDVKLIYIMRHPIDRLISQYIHEWTQRVISCSLNEAIDNHLELIAYSRYATQLRPFCDEFGQEGVLPMFAERIAAEPQRELERACRFIGYESNPQWDNSIGEQNMSSQRLRASPVRDAMINLPVVKQLRQTLVPKALRERIKRMWMMDGRPQLSPSNCLRLEAIFDDDLAQVGDWLGVDMRCSTFKNVVTSSELEWRERVSAGVA